MKKRYQIIFMALVLLLLYFVLNKVGFSNILQSLKMLKWYYPLLAAAINLFVFMVWNYKWKLLVDKVHKVKFWELFSIMMAGNFVGTSTPTMNLGGDPLKVYYLSNKFKKEKSKYMHTVVIDKLTNVSMWLAFTIISLVLASIYLKVSTLVKVSIESLVVIFIIILALIFFYKNINKEKIVKAIYPLFRKKFPASRTSVSTYFFTFTLLPLSALARLSTLPCPAASLDASPGAASAALLFPVCFRFPFSPPRLVRI